jgi:hypothetical protein
MKINDEQAHRWLLGSLEVEECSEYTYLGVVLEANKAIFKKHKASIIAKANKLSGWVKHVAFRSHNKYLIGRTLWKSVAVPSLTYGNEIVPSNIGFMSELDTIQNRLGRFLLGGNKLSPLIACQGDMGWSKFEDRDALSKLKYMGRLTFMKDERIAKAVFKLNEISPLAGQWDELAEYYDCDVTTSIISNAAWDKLMTASVRQVSAELFLETVEIHSTLEVYKCKTEPKVINFYENTKGSALLFQARSGSLPLNSRTHHWNGYGKDCRVCDSSHEESLKHFIFDCPVYDSEREILFQKFKDWDKNSDTGFLEAIRSLLGFNYENLTYNMKIFLSHCWKKRQDILSSMQ